MTTIDPSDRPKSSLPAEEDAARNSDEIGLSASDKVFVRLTLWQTVLGIAGLLVAIVALYAALTESAAVRHQTAAAVWPFVQFSIDDYDIEEGAVFRMSFTNAGVGPALMRDVRLLIAGSPARDFADALRLLDADPSASAGLSFIGNRVIRPDETVTMLDTEDPELARRFQAAVTDAANSISYCYCSIFDECWLADSRKDLQDPEEVDVCPDFGDEAWQN